MDSVRLLAVRVSAQAAGGALVLSSAGAVAVSGQPTSADASVPFPTMSTCNIKTFTGNYLTAVGGGGRDGVSFDALHTNATVASGWETFSVVNVGGGEVSIQSSNGNYLTAVGGGGQTTDAIRTDSTRLGANETFTPVPIAGQPAGVFGI